MIGPVSKIHNTPIELCLAGVISLTLGIGCIWERHNSHTLMELREQRTKSDFFNRGHENYHKDMNQGDEYKEKGNFEAATMCYRAALEKAKTFNLSRKDLIVAMYAVASGCTCDEEAFSNYKQIAHIQEKFYGANKPDTTYSLLNFAIYSDRTGRTNLAEKAFKRMLSIWEKAPAVLSDNVEVSLRNLAFFYLEHKRAQEAQPLLIRAIALMDKNPHTDPAQLYSILNRLTGTYSIKEFKHIEPLLLRKLALLKNSSYGNDTEYGALWQLAELYVDNNEGKKAKPIIKRIEDIVTASSAHDCRPDSWADDIEAVARLYQKIGKKKLAQKMQAMALRMRKLYKPLTEPPILYGTSYGSLKGPYEGYFYIRPDGVKVRIE